METLSYIWLHIGLPVVAVVLILSGLALFLCVLDYALEKYAEWLVDRYG